MEGKNRVIQGFTSLVLWKSVFVVDTLPIHEMLKILTVCPCFYSLFALHLVDECTRIWVTHKSEKTFMRLVNFLSPRMFRLGAFSANVLFARHQETLVSASDKRFALVLRELLSASIPSTSFEFDHWYQSCSKARQTDVPQKLYSAARRFHVS